MAARAVMPVVLVAALAAGACDDGNEIVTRSPTPEGPTPALQGAAQEFYDLLSDGFRATYRVEYRTASPEGEELDSFAVYNKSYRTRIDTIPADGRDASSLVIGGDEQSQTVSCTNQETGWACFEIEPLGESLLLAAGPNVLPTIWDIGAARVEAVEPRTVAEQAATCYRVTGESEPGAAEYCLSAQGVPLFTASVDLVVEATSLSSEVEDADLEPPALPQRAFASRRR